VWFLRGFDNLPALLSLVPTLLLLFVFAWSMALIAGFANVYFQDTQHLTEVGFKILFYGTPINLQDGPTRQRAAGDARQLQPHHPLLDLVRQPIIFATVPDPSTFPAGRPDRVPPATVATVVCHRAQRQLIFHL